MGDKHFFHNAIRVRKLCRLSWFNWLIQGYAKHAVNTFLEACHPHIPFNRLVSMSEAS